MNNVMAIFILLILVVGCAPSGNIVTNPLKKPATVDNKSTQVPPSAALSYDNQTTKVVPTATNQATPLQGIPVNLRYDYLNADENLFTQVAIHHSYITPSTFGIAGTSVETPLIILPNRNGSVCIIKDTYGSGGYKYQPTDIQYQDIVYENEKLSKPGWGLATTFHPDKTPFAIRNIRIAGVAYYTTGILDDYDKKNIIINILNNKSEVIWSRCFKWSDFRGTDTTPRWPMIPPAVWRDIAVNNVTVDGDFTVDILSPSLMYSELGDQYDYFTIAYERFVKCGDVITNSFISRNGQRCNPYIRLYDQYGDPECFNLCIRVDGIY